MGKFLFVVQGEGRGHLTQALSLHRILSENGHRVVAVLVGKSNRVIPAFFTEQIQAPVHFFESPNFVKDKKNRGINIWATIFYNMGKFKTFISSLRQMQNWYKAYKPDVIINFYDFLGGFYNIVYRNPIPMAVIGHQYLLQHPQFEFPKNHFLDKFLLNQNTQITSFGAKVKLALSFLPSLSNHRKIEVVPPLLRKEVLELRAEKQDFILAYINTDGYAQDIISWHKSHPSVRIECFWDKKDAQEVEVFSENLIFHQISDVKFLEKMRICKAYITTAGFESVCEAMYLDKPVLVVPIEGQFEQVCNALDAERAGLGVSNKDFNLDTLLAYLPSHKPLPNAQVWVKQASKMFLEKLEALLPASNL